MLSALKRFLGAVDPRTSWIGYLFSAWILLSLGLTILDPSASRDLSFPMRLLFWLGHVGAGLIILEAVQIALGRTVLSDRLQPWAQILLAGVVGAILLSAFSFFALDPLFARYGAEAGSDGSTFVEFLSEIRFSAGATVLFWLLLNGPRLVKIAQQRELDLVPALSTPDTGPILNAESGDKTALSHLLQKLPHRIGTDLVALSAELHYLRVYTSQGNALILMPLGKAIKAVESIRGVAIHRSHWIATDYLAEVRTQGDRVLCRMTTGLVLPVSRTGRSLLRIAVDERRREMASRDAELLARRKPSGSASTTRGTAKKAGP